MAERRPIERVRGTQDSWPPEAQPLATILRSLEATFQSYGYRRLDVPVLELAELHLRKSGLEIISKLYAFADQGGRQLCLRPELTASVARAYVARPAPRLPVKVYSAGPVFRYERPAKGRYRQFTQCGVELIGADSTAADAEVIALAVDALESVALGQYVVTIGHVGALHEFLGRLGLSGRLRALLLDSVEDVRRHGPSEVRERLQDLDPDLFDTAGDGDAARIAPDAPAEAAVSLNSTAEARGERSMVADLLQRTEQSSLGRRTGDEVVERLLGKLRPAATGAAVERALGFIERLGRVRGAAQEALAAGRALLRDYDLSDEPLRALEETATLLGRYGVDTNRVQLDLGLSRGLQYYTGTVFEIDHPGLGAESQLCGGGRYDDLIQALGGRQPVPALGFAFGLERIHLALEAEGRSAGEREPAVIFVAAAGAEQAGYAAQVAQALRRANVAAHLDVVARPLRAALAYADREGFTEVAIAGADEARSGSFRLRNMASGEEQVVELARLDQHDFQVQDLKLSTGPVAGNREG